MDHNNHHGSDRMDHSNHSMDTLDNSSIIEEENEIHELHERVEHSSALHFGVQETILLSSLRTSTTGGFIFACICLAALAFLLEILKKWANDAERTLQCRLESNGCADAPPRTGDRYHNGSCRNNSAMSQVGSLVKDGNDPTSKTALFDSKRRNSGFCRQIWHWLKYSFLHIIIYAKHLLIMLVAMTFNVYIIAALAIGATAGKVTVLLINARNSKTRCKRNLCDNSLTAQTSIEGVDGCHLYTIEQRDKN